MSHLDKEIPLVSLQMQRAKISDLLPPRFVVRTQPACSAIFISLDIPIYSLKFLQSVQETKHVIP